MTGNGGVLFADVQCANVSFTNSTFVSNSAGAGPVSFLEGWKKFKNVSTAPTCSGNCSFVNNSATFWGASEVAATDIDAAEISFSRRTVSSGGTFAAIVTLRDGFGTTVENTLPGVTFQVTCANCSHVAGAALNGAATGKYGGVSRIGELSIVGPQRPYALAVTVDQNDQFINTTLTASAVMTVVACSLTENFDEGSGMCICIRESNPRWRPPTHLSPQQEHSGRGISRDHVAKFLLY